jgi:hypothetical protein
MFLFFLIFVSITYKVWSSAVIDSPISCSSADQNGILKKKNKLGWVGGLDSWKQLKLRFLEASFLNCKDLESSLRVYGIKTVQIWLFKLLILLGHLRSHFMNCWDLFKLKVKKEGKGFKRFQIPFPVCEDIHNLEAYSFSNLWLG